MKTSLHSVRLWLFVLLAAFVASAEAQLIRPSAGAVATALQEDEGEVQTSGPIHEGFARPTVFDEEAEPFYSEVDPPTLIDETPPLERPEGYSEWVPGYWSWDDDRSNYMWVSGTWRCPPPSHVWISGYWKRTWRGWRYVPGFWTQVGYGNGEIDYMPSPPPTLEGGPVGYAPWANAIWIPGNWVWYSGGFMGWMWRPGYWMVANPAWVWVPARYGWTPYGYVYTEGHWDYPVNQCGFLYAPVSFHDHSYLRPGYSYTPSFVINITLFGAGFFSRPSYGHYYFGDYYAPSCWNRGIYPAFSFHYSKYGYDPHFAHAICLNGKGDPRWIDSHRDHFLYLRDHKDARPPRTLREQLSRPRNAVRLPPDVHETDNNSFAVSVKDVGPKFTGQKVQRLPESDRAKLVAQAQDMRKARGERVKIETLDATTKDTAPEAPRRVKPIGFVPGAITTAAVAGAAVATPKRPELPQAKPEIPGTDQRIQKDTRSPKLRTPSLDRPSVDLEPKTDPKVDPKRDPRFDPKTDPKVDPKRDPRFDPKTDPKVDPKRDPRFDPKTDPKVDPKRDPRFDPKTDPKVDPKRDPRFDPKTDPKVDPKRDPRFDPKTDPKVDPKRDPRFDPKTDPKVDPKRDPRFDPKTDPKVDPKRDPRFDPKTDPKVDPKRDPRFDPKTDPKVDPKRDPRFDPKTDPKVDPKRDPRFDPKTDPKVDPKRDPRFDPKTDPKVDPKRDPRFDPKTDPKTNPTPDARRRLDPKADPRGAPRRLKPEDTESQPVVPKPLDGKPQ